VPRLRPARTRVLALFFFVRGGGLGRGALIFIRPLKPEHQLDQLVFAELLQITAIHAAILVWTASDGINCARMRLLRSQTKETVRGTD
jgi:hypothetical protein